MKRLIIMLLAACLFLTGCGGVSAPQTTPEPATTPAPEPTTTPAPTTLPETTPETTPVPETTPAPTEPPLPYVHPITGEGLAQPHTSRPVAVVINNISAAQPLYGVGEADVIFEIVAEGGGSITRLLAVFSDIGAVGDIGSIRSARTYLIDLARSYDAPLVHCGGSSYALDQLNSGQWAHLDEMYNEKYFYRNQSRVAAGYSWEHTLFTTGEKLLAGLTARGYRMTLKDEQKGYGYTFGEEIDLQGAPANTLVAHFSQRSKTTTLEYDSLTGCYFATQHWLGGKVEALADANTGDQVAFRNVLMLKAVTTSDGERMFAELTGQGTGYYACGGQYVPIKWYRDGLTAPFRYTLEDGTPITLGVGKSFIAIIPHKVDVEIQ